MYKCYWPCGAEHSTNNLRGCVSADRPTSHTRRLYRLPVSITRVHGVSTDCQLNVHECTKAIGLVVPDVVQTFCEVASLPTAQPRTQGVSTEGITFKRSWIPLDSLLFCLKKITKRKRKLHNRSNGLILALLLPNVAYMSTRNKKYYFLQNFKFKTIGPDPNTAPFQSLLLNNVIRVLGFYLCFCCVIAIWKKTYGLSPYGTLFFVVSGKTISCVIGPSTLRTHESLSQHLARVQQ